MNRRQLLRGILAAGAAAALPKVRASEMHEGTLGRWVGFDFCQGAGKTSLALTIRDIERLKESLHAVVGIQDRVLVVAPRQFEELRRSRILGAINGVRVERYRA